MRMRSITWNRRWISVGVAMLLSGVVLADEPTEVRPDNGAVASIGAEHAPSFWVQLDLGPAWQSRNDVQIPSTTGTRLSLVDWGSGPVLGSRIYFGARLGGRHEARLLFAPLSLTVNGELPSETSFNEEIFEPGVATQALYQFNSYRLTYRYLVLDGEAWKIRVGLTGKIRDAEIRFTQGAKSSARTDLGFVPLLHFAADWQFLPQWTLALDADALWSPYGRAEDLSLLVHYQVNDWFSVHSGYRTVEGGSDGGGKVYTFAWIHYFVSGVTARF